MQRNYEEDTIVDLYDQGISLAEIQAALNNPKSRLIEGHIDYQQFFDHSNIYTFTFLRDPIDRVISNYIHIKNSTSELHQQWMKKVNSFPDFLNLPQGSNWQSRFLGGFKNTLPQNDSELFEKASSNLKKLNFVGLTEDFKHSLYCLSLDLNWVRIWYKKENVGGFKSEFEEIRTQYHNEIKAANLVDLELYELGKKRFNERWKQVTNLERMQCRLRRMKK